MNLSFIIRIITICFIPLTHLAAQSDTGNDLYYSNDIVVANNKCYAKSLVKKPAWAYEDTYPVYQGEEVVSGIDVVIKEIVINPGKSTWRKQKNDNCDAPDPEDCMVWCLVPEGREVERYQILLDTSQSDNFKMLDIKESGVYSVNYLAWTEVICPERLSPRLIGQLQEKLKEKDYYKGKLNNTLDVDTKSALVRYQMDNGLPIGNVNIETLKSMK